MKDRDKSARDDFERAASGLEAWRRYQESLLTVAQQREWEKLKARQIKDLKAARSEFFEHRYERIAETMEDLLRDKPDLALRMLPTEKLRKERAYQLANRMISKQHDDEKRVMENDHVQSRDRYLHDAEQQRNQERTAAVEQEQDQELENLSEAFKERAEQKDRQRGDDGRDRTR